MLASQDTRQPGRMAGGSVIWLNGAFGVGKTTVARALAAELPGALLMDPEDIGRMLRRIVPAAVFTSDFQQIPSWRRLTVATIESLLRDHPGPLVVPMTVVDPVYFDETVGRLRQAGITVHHFTLAAGPKTIRRRLLWRVSVPWATWWAWRRVQRCTGALRSSLFATHVDTENRSVPDIVATVISELARNGLNAGSWDDRAQENDGFHGFRPLPKRGKPVTNELIDRLRDDEPDRPT